jgi:hypothetical protein
VEHPPDVDVVVALDVEHQIGVALQPVAAQSGNCQLMRIARRPSGGMVGDGAEGSLHGVNEAQCDVGPGFADVIGDGGFDIPTGQLARRTGFSLNRLWLGGPGP